MTTYAFVMESDDLASNLEFWSGRTRNGGAGEETPRRPRAPRWLSLARFSPRRGRLGTPGRARPVAAAALLAALTAGWLVAGHSSHSSGALAEPPVAPVTTTTPAPAPRAATPTTATPTTATSTTATSTTATSTTGAVPSTPGCAGLAPRRPEVRCVVDAVDLDVRLVPPNDATAAYERATGVHPVPGTGSPACARGVPDERTWSLATAPVAAVGRYLCRIEHGRAAMWWIQGERLAHAVAHDGDLARLFSWWRAHPTE
jgi:hypothetical protein